MAIQFDRDTIERFKAMPARQALDEVRDTCHRDDRSTTEGFQEACRQLVDEGVLTWDQID